MRSLWEVWMDIGVEKLENHEGVTVKVLLDSGAMGLFANKKFVEKHRFKLEKLERPIRVPNIDGMDNKGKRITYEIECNVFFKEHKERTRMEVCDLWRMDVILGMLWLAAYNPEINWEMGEVKMTRCLPFYRRKVEIKERRRG